MISVSDAKMILKKNISPLPSTVISIAEAIGFVLSHDIESGVDVPSFTNSSMDGYAFQYTEDRRSYKVTQSVQAGEISRTYLQTGEAARIFTGAALPPGADTVVQQELVKAVEDSIEFDQGCVSKGANVRLRGAQCSAGDVVVKKGSVVTPGLVGLSASLGIKSVQVYSPPSVGIIITGNELVEPGEFLPAGKIYNSNEPALLAYLGLLRIRNVESFRARDDRQELKKTLEHCLAKFDAVIITGGISVGDYDFVEAVLSESGAEILFHGVKQKPGKPMCAGRYEGKIVFALPGNPASVITCFNQYVKPGLLGMMGHANSFCEDSIIPLANEWQKKAGLTQILKGRIDSGKVNILAGQDSFNLLPFNEADCFVILDEEKEFFQAGTEVRICNW
jgi:molybdopterin molybdotransferase